MAIRFSCSCGRVLNIKDELAGKKGKCPECGKVVSVPMESEPEPTPEEIKAQAEAEAEVQAQALVAEAAAAAALKPCPHCGKPLAIDAIFCVNCGTHLETGDKHELTVHEAEAGHKFDFLATMGDMILHPEQAAGAFMEAPSTPQNFYKAVIAVAAGLALFTYVIPHCTEEAIQNGALWYAYPVCAVLGVVIIFTDVIACNFAANMFGTTGMPLTNVFPAVLSVRALIGLAMIVPAVYLVFSGASANALFIAWVPRVIRFGWGVALYYFVIYRAYDCGPVPALVFAAGATLVQGALFWIPSLFGIYLL
jgi:DNA-directed RNA polymerase subunit M/transcription elongation factor TFIIS